MVAFRRVATPAGKEKKRRGGKRKGEKGRRRCVPGVSYARQNSASSTTSSIPTRSIEGGRGKEKRTETGVQARWCCIDLHSPKPHMALVSGLARSPELRNRPLLTQREKRKGGDRKHGKRAIEATPIPEKVHPHRPMGRDVL